GVVVRQRVSGEYEIRGNCPVQIEIEKVAARTGHERILNGNVERTAGALEHECIVGEVPGSANRGERRSGDGDPVQALGGVVEDVERIVNRTGEGAVRYRGRSGQSGEVDIAFTHSALIRAIRAVDDRIGHSEAGHVR